MTSSAAPARASTSSPKVRRKIRHGSLGDTLVKNAMIAVAVSLVCGAVYLMLRPSAAKEDTASAYEDLSACAHLTSMDSRRSLYLAASHVARLSEMTGAGMQWATGSWRLLDEDQHRYGIDIAGVDTTYTLVSAPEGEGCMLVKGRPNAADLLGSWFSALTDPKE